MDIFIAIILVVSAWLYILLAGADLGAGILERFKGKTLKREQEALITDAMGPVWEANHIWIILGVVIMFVGFPKAFRDLVVFYHIPLTAMLIGIVGRGTAFTFRHYDAVKGKSQRWYSVLFSLSSIWTTLWLGILAGSITMGNIPRHGNHFVEVYIDPWFNPFSFLIGIFLCSLLAYISATYLVAEATTSEGKELFKKRAVIANIVSILLGILVFVYGYFSDIQLIREFLLHPYSMLAFAFSSSLLIFQWYAIKKKQYQYLKYLGGGQITLILLGWLIVQYPYVFRWKGGGGLMLLDTIAPEAVQLQLTIALVVGLIVILPPYLYLMHIFKIRK